MKKEQEIILSKEIIKRVCKVLNANMQEVMGERQNKQNVEIRFILFKLLKQRTSLSYKNIGGLFKRSQSTVINGLKMFKDFILCKDKDFLAKIEKVESEFLEFSFFDPPQLETEKEESEFSEFRVFDPKTLETEIEEMETIQQDIFMQLIQLNHGSDFEKNVLCKLIETLFKKEIIYKKRLKKSQTNEENEK